MGSLESHIILLQFNSKLKKGNLESKPKEPKKKPKEITIGNFGKRTSFAHNIFQINKP